MYSRSVRGEAERAGLRRLLFSRDEAEAILSAVRPRQSGLEALDFRASRKMAMSGELSQYRIIHCSTHGLLDSRHPELSGLVLSLVDEAGQPQEGFLRLHEIYDLRLNADLVVLSACQTGLGRDVKGEGLIGLTRGFMYAGAPRVMASLWQVDDAATAELMKRFYRGVLHESHPSRDARPGTPPWGVARLCERNPRLATIMKFKRAKRATAQTPKVTDDEQAVAHFAGCNLAYCSPGLERPG